MSFDKMWYTYKLTSESDDFYYLGVRSCPVNYTPETDIYLGSGSTQKFIHWREKHLLLNNLKKEILETFASSEKAYSAEEKLIGNL